MAGAEVGVDDAPDPLLKVSGTRLETRDGTPVRLRGAGLGGWMNMENFITGYPSSESTMHSAVREGGPG